MSDKGVMYWLGLKRYQDWHSIVGQYLGPYRYRMSHDQHSVTSYN